MVDQDDVRRIALSLPGTREGEDRFAFSVEHAGKRKGFAWVWMERKQPGKPRVPRPAVLAIRVKNQGEKAALIAGDPERFFTEPHYNGFPAVLVRLAKVNRAQLQTLLEHAWRCQAPRALSARGTPEAPARRTRRPRGR
jgi:hypothetical protein